MTTNVTAQYTVLSAKKSATQEEKPPLIKDAIKSLKDGMYPIVRGAYLFDWKYYILESHKFRLNVKDAIDPELSEQISRCFDQEVPIFVMVQGREYCVIGGQPGKKNTWKQYPGEKATSWVYDSPLPDYTPLPEPKSIDEIPF